MLSFESGFIFQNSQFILPSSSQYSNCMAANALDAVGELYGLQTAARDSRSAADAAHCGKLHMVDDAATCPVYAVEGCGLWSAADDLDDAGCCVC